MGDQDGAASIDEGSDRWEVAPLTEEQAASRDAFVASVQELYNAGTPLFTKDMIQLAQDRIDQLVKDAVPPDKVDQLGFDGKMHAQYFPSWLFTKTDDEIYVPVISYSSFESLTILPPYDRGDDSMVSVKISVSHHRIDGESDESGASQDDVRCAFDEYLHLWEQGDEWAGLKERIRPCLSTLPVTIDKIIGFGLGNLSMEATCDVDDGRKRRCSEQHALMLTLAKMFEEHTGNSVKCYAQDPAYWDACKETLAQRGVDVVHGDTGFLLVDENSVVLSFSPNVPVRQVIADLTRPAMMVCDIMSKPDRTEWRRSGDCFFSPYTTDPVSPRVLAMKEEYIELPISTVVSISKSAVYIRKEKTSKRPEGSS